MGNLDIIAKTIIFYLVLIIIIRLLGKREVGEISVFDLVVLLLVADIATLAITDGWNFVVPSLVSLFSLLLLQKLFAYISLKLPKIRKVIDYSSSVIMFDGKLNIKEMNKQKYTIDDLVAQAREKGVMDLNEIRMAILESTGQLSIYKKDLYKNLILPVVISGIINKENLILLNMEEEIIVKFVNEQHMMIKEVNYLSSDGKKFYMLDSL